MPLASSLCSLPALCSCGTPGTLAAVAESDGGEGHKEREDPAEGEEKGQRTPTMATFWPYEIVES